ncbi:hypothetical protein [Actinoplanes derwentensis]|uniref:Uncharacterized protein n=2 Tax=Actinoplanes derwentensis TaxID=113562 RepID=A0A1H1X4I8_9ACTN|nr:hypothetical protein [Actinoplanes derwentensis]SDT03971.1 hypothetical protein SAMN04489716_2330 [Actinoplanes derwentensis]
MLALVLPFVRLLRRPMVGRFDARVWIVRTATVAGLAGGVIMLVVSVALPVFHFPVPTGRYGIGTVTYHWVDQARPELFTADPAAHRELMAQVWYPATPSRDAERAPYIADADAVTSASARLAGPPPFLFSHFRHVTTNAVAGVPLDDVDIATPQASSLTGLRN